MGDAQPRIESCVYVKTGGTITYGAAPDTDSVTIEDGTFFHGVSAICAFLTDMSINSGYVFDLNFSTGNTSQRHVKVTSPDLSVTIDWGTATYIRDILGETGAVGPTPSPYYFTNECELAYICERSDDGVALHFHRDILENQRGWSNQQLAIDGSTFNISPPPSYERHGWIEIFLDFTPTDYQNDRSLKANDWLRFSSFMQNYMMREIVVIFPDESTTQDYDLWCLSEDSKKLEYRWWPDEKMELGEIITLSLEWDNTPQVVNILGGGGWGSEVGW